MAINTSISFLLLGIIIDLLILRKDIKDKDSLKLDIPLERKIILSFGLALSLIISITLLSYEGILKLRNTNADVTEFSNFTGLLNESLLYMKDALSSERGYVITENKNYLNSFDSSFKKLDRNRILIDEMSNKIVNYKSQIDSINSIIFEMITFYQQVLDIRKVEGFEASQNMIATNYGENLIEKVSAIVNKINNDEKNLLAQKRLDIQKSINKDIFIFSFAIIIVLFLLSFAYIVIQRDLLNKQQYEQELKSTKDLLNSIIENIPAMIFLKDATEFKFTLFNKAGEKLLGYSRDEMIGKSDYDFFPKEEADSFIAKDREVLSAKKLLTVEEEGVQTKYKTKKILHTKKLGLFNKDGEPEYLLGISEDITAKKKMESATLKLNNELKMTNAELESFSYSVSHDLRAPIRHISGFLEILHTNIAESLDDKNKRYFKLIKESTIEMGRLIDDLLTFSRMGRAALNYSQVNLNIIIESIIKNLQPDIIRRKIDWKINPVPKVYADPSLIKVVLDNLFSNAVKYTSKNQNAIIEFGSIESNSLEHIFYLKDNGVGFDANYIDKLFGVFQRLHTADEFEGTGIGLATVKKIISKHGGRVWAESNLNEGATFYFTIPIEFQD